MAVKSYKPTSAGMRHRIVPSFEEITSSTPEKSLLAPIKKTAGRNDHGHITVRHRGGGNRRKYRIIDFKRLKDNIPATVATIEYDPNRTCYIALLHYADGEKRYILAPNKLKVGDQVESGESVDIQIGNALPLRSIPLGTHIHNIEMKIGKGGQLVRSAGTYAQLMAREGKYAQVRLPSGEVRLIHVECRATVGQVGNLEHENINYGKAGSRRHLGFRPHVRGSAMNPVDHPHGGGEGKAPIGRPSPVTPWGKPTLGYKTRNKNKVSNKYILKKRTK